MAVLQRKCEFCFKSSTAPCETQTQADRCSRNRNPIRKTLIKQSRMKISDIIGGFIVAMLFLTLLLSACTRRYYTQEELHLRATYKERYPNSDSALVIEDWMMPAPKKEIN